MIKILASTLLLLSSLISISQSGNSRKVEPIKSLETNSRESSVDTSFIFHDSTNDPVPNPCDHLLRKVDDFTGTVSIYSNDLANSEKYIFIKTITKKGGVSYVLRLTAIGLTLNLGCSGVIVMFSDLTQFKKPNISIDVEANDDLDYEYTAYIPLTLIELNLFIKKPIKKFRLYIHDQEVENYRADLVTCLKSAK